MCYNKEAKLFGSGVEDHWARFWTLESLKCHEFLQIEPLLMPSTMWKRFILSILYTSLSPCIILEPELIPAY